MGTRSDSRNGMNTERASSGVGVLEALTGVFLVLYVGSTFLRADNTSSPLFDAWIGNLAYGGSALLCGWKAVRTRSARAAWLFITASLAVFTLGSVLWTTTIQFLDPVPYPSLADLCFLAFYPIAYIGIGLLIRDSLRQRANGAI
jgi:hypothetical protein